MKMTRNTDSTASSTTADRAAHTPSRTGFLSSSTREILLYRTLYRSSQASSRMPATEGSSMAMATAEPV